VVHRGVVAGVAGECPAAAGKTKPAVALSVVLARPPIGEGRAAADTHVLLALARLRHLASGLASLLLLLRHLAPVRDTQSVELGAIDYQIHPRVAGGAIIALPVARANLTDPHAMRALLASRLEITPQQLNWLATDS
jgi:hypothetical protein